METTKFFIKLYYTFDTNCQEYVAIIKFILPKNDYNELKSAFRNKLVSFLGQVLDRYWGVEYYFDNDWYRAYEYEIRDIDLKKLQENAKEKLNELKDELIKIVTNNKKAIEKLPKDKIIEVII